MIAFAATRPLATAPSEMVRPARRRPVRLTRRGRGLVGLLIGLLAFGAFALLSPPGTAGAPTGPAPVAVVEPGDSLWSVAARALPGLPPRTAIDEIRRLNELTDSTVHPGQRLVLPRTAR